MTKPRFLLKEKEKILKLLIESGKMPFLFAKYFFCSNKRFYYEDENFKFEKKRKN